MLLIGLTGGIASGKTLVSDSFAQLQVPIIDADVLARAVVEPDSIGLDALVSAFGNNILTTQAELDRSELRRIIFASQEHRQTVNAILHPLIRKLGDKAIQQAAGQNHTYAIYVIPLLVETRQQTRFDRILVVDTPVELQIKRLMARDNSSREDVMAVLSAQANRQQRLALADDVLINDGDIMSLRSDVARLHQQYLKLAQE